MTEHEKIRQGILEILTRDLFGPYLGTEEVMIDNPLGRYSSGILFPRNTGFDKESDDGVPGKETGVQEEATEGGIVLSNTMQPSCYGITFACQDTTREIQVQVNAGIYRDDDPKKGVQASKDKITSESPGFGDRGVTPNDPAPVSPGEAETLRSAETRAKERDGRKSWKRTGVEWSMCIPVNTPGEKAYVVVPGLILRCRARTPDNKGIRPVTLSLVNEQISGADTPDDRCKKCFFQVHISASGSSKNRPFLDRRVTFEGQGNKEADSIRLLYRTVNSYAIGHGCSASWADESEGKAGRIESSFVPNHPVFAMVAPRDQGPPRFGIRQIADSEAQQLSRLFDTIPASYEKWIENQTQKGVGIPADLVEAAKRHVELCKESLGRIRSGIALIRKDPQVCEAFKLAHRAMLYQFAHSSWMNAGKPSDRRPSYDDSHSWYPFQIAFILQCLESVSNVESVDREIVDLLWFPTGGGKTEAYLGLTAFILFLRRLRGADSPHRGGGTAVLTRYTLRLLTVDQFYRGALLACSCEKVRKESGGKLAGTTPISIGLWVGGGASPNDLDDAKKALKKLSSGEDVKISGSPVKLRECPWCGTDLGVADYTISGTPKGLRVRCPNGACDFRTGIPVWGVDEDIYRERPSIIIGTVDKFARLPWKKEAGFIFGSDGRTLPPDLVIQDELHLISGPLGTLVGLYEVAIDLLCKGAGGHPPKIISSTATIRNAQSQIRSLFCRGMRQFPQPCLDYRDSFFAREDKEKPARLYAGVFAPSLSPTTALIRTFACLLHGVSVSQLDEKVKDPYWTLVGYFNSMRELGGARRQVEDDVQDYLRFCAVRDGDPSRSRELEIIEEITSRVNDSDLDFVRKALKNSYPDNGPLDVVLATNMISVGLDVPRLGIMGVVGQPKSTSEYIQATSRIGRRFPGLVVTIYNWTRSRDRSHYERFNTYHGHLYSEVEATSVTPFSSRSRDRGLHAVLVTLIRHLLPGMADNDAAIRFVPGNAKVKEILSAIMKRVEQIDPLELDQTGKDLEAIVEKWQSLVGTCADLPYSSMKKISLLRFAEEQDGATESFPTLNSLRNIDPSAGLYLEKN